MGEETLRYQPSKPVENRIGRLVFVGRYLGLQVLAGILWAVLAPNLFELAVMVCFAIGLWAYWEAVKRSHDLNKSGWYNLILFVPIANFVWFLVLALRKGTEGSNRFGESPAIRRENIRGIHQNDISLSIKHINEGIETDEEPLKYGNVQRELAKLKDLWDKGLISESTYEESQRRIIARM